jgi:hypothetical protein
MQDRITTFIQRLAGARDVLGSNLSPVAAVLNYDFRSYFWSSHIYLCVHKVKVNPAIVFSNSFSSALLISFNFSLDYVLRDCLAL